jgi:plastocyanin
VPDDEHDPARFWLIAMAVTLALTMLPLTVVAAVAVANHDGSQTRTAAGPAPGTRTPTCPASSTLTGTVADKGGEVVEGAAFDVAAGDSFFDPTCSLSVPDGPATVTFTNTGEILHNVSIPSLDIDENLEAGQSVTITVPVGDEPIGYFCKFHRTSGMVGVLTPA